MPSTPTPSALAYQPALDGLRALCLIAVLLFHSGFAWMSGGFLGVSTFFTLSGYLITSLLLVENERTGGVSYTGFWGRRLRRLMPAALIGISAVVASSPFWLTAEERARLTGDALAALVYAINWRFVQEDYAYEAIFVAPSPLQHFWSLAIEAQFYLFFPLVIGLLVRVGTGRRGLALILAALAAASVAISFTFPLTDEGITRIYYGSDSRFAEILFGALLAVALRGVPGAAKASPVVSVAGVVGLLALLGAWVFTGLGDDVLYRGGFAVYALASTCVVAAAVSPVGAVRRLLSLEPLPWMGRISYGAYVYHWPVFLVLDEERTGLPAVALLALRLVVTLGAAELSYRWVESPVRSRESVVGRVFGWALVPCVAGVAALAFWLAPASPGETLARLWYGSRIPAGGPVRVADGPLEPYRVGIFGDSVAHTLSRAIALEARGRADLASVDATLFGCGLVATGERAAVGGAFRPVHERCLGGAERWRTIAAEEEIDLAVVLIGTWDLRNWRSEEGAPVLAVGLPEFDGALAQSIRSHLEALQSPGVRVLLLTLPHMGDNPRVPPSGQAAWSAAANPRRADRVNEILREEAAAFPNVRVVDLVRFVEDWPGGEFDPALRADTIHFTDDGAIQVRDQLLAPVIEQIRAVPKGQPIAGAAPVEDPVRVGLFGDSTAFSLRYGVERWARRDEGTHFALDATRFGCGIVEKGRRSTSHGRFRPIREECIGLAEIWREQASSNKLDVALVLTGVWDLRHRVFGSPKFVEMLSESLRARMEALVAGGARVVWLTVPEFGVRPDMPKAGRAAAEQAAKPHRAALWNEILRREAAAFPEVQVEDLGAFVEAWPGGKFDPELRFDLLHFTNSAAVVVLDQWLGEKLLAAGAPRPDE